MALVWSGYTWTPRDQGSSNPGPNLWSAGNASVNGAGQLLLTVNQQAGNWYATEVVGPHLGYGRYSWRIASPVHDFDRHLVLSLFVYDETAGPYFREIDIEIAQFSQANSERGWLTLQPGGANKGFWFNPRTTAPNTFDVVWAAGKIRWENRDAAGRVVETFLCTTDVPTPGTNALVRMNLWLFGGTAPADGLARSVTFDSFTFTAAAAVADRAPAAHLADTFPYGSFSSLGQPTAKGRFTNTFGTPTAPSIVGGRGRLTLASGAAAYTGIGSGPQSDVTRQFDLTSSEVFVRWHAYPNDGAGTTEASLECRVDPDTLQNLLGMTKAGNTLYLRYVAAGTASTTTVPWVVGVMDWWRIREAAGVTYWETSANGTAWATLRAVATPITVTAVYPYVYAGHYGTESDPGIAEFDNFNEPGSEAGVPSGYPYLGYAGALAQLPSPAPGYEPVDVLRGGTHELLAGGNVRDRFGVRRRFTLIWPATSDDNYALLRTLARFPGPYRYLDPLERNLLTANQSSGTDDRSAAEGFSAHTQGSVSSSTGFARSWTRSLAWNTVTSLSATGRGIRLYTINPGVDASWAAVRPSTQYTLSGYLRASAAVSMQALFDWHDYAGTYISTSVGSAVAVSTANFNTRVTLTATSPPTAAYGIGAWVNTTTPGTTITVYFDELQLEEAAAASTFRLGAGTPLVSVDSLGHSILLADGTAGFALHEVELVLVEA
jgi:hypothetical protein